MTAYLTTGAVLLVTIALFALGVDVGTRIYGTGGLSSRVGRRIRNWALVFSVVVFLACVVAGIAATVFG